MESPGASNDIQNMYDMALEKATCDTNVPQNFTASYIYDLPFGQGRRFNISNRFLNGVFGGWEWGGITSFISGFPLNITTSGDVAEVGTGTQRANFTGIAVTKLNPRTNGLKGFNTASFSTPAAGTFGNLGRNVVQGFGINDWDMGIDKNFALHMLGEAGRLQIRGEFFNIWNHTQFSGIGTVVNQPATFGLVNSTNPPRIIQLAAKLYW